MCSKWFIALPYQLICLPLTCPSLLLSIFVPVTRIIFPKVFDYVIFQLKNIFKFHIIYQTEPNSLTWLVRPITQSVYPPYKLQPPRINESFIKMSCSFWSSPMAWEALSSLLCLNYNFPTILSESFSYPPCFAFS